MKPVDHLGRRDTTTNEELLYTLAEFEKRYRPNGRREGPPSRYDTSRMYNAVRPVLVAALPQIAKTPHTGARMVPVIMALIDMMDKQSPFFYGHEYGTSPYLPDEETKAKVLAERKELHKKAKQKKAHVPKILGDEPPPDPETEPDNDADDFAICDINGSGYWDMTGD
jgi:hypothetical protein